jgi:hypothetical protein
MTRIEVIVSPKGQVTVQTVGFAGPACRQASRALEQALGAVVSDRPTAELYEAAPVSQPQVIADGPPG